MLGVQAVAGCNGSTVSVLRQPRQVHNSQPCLLSIGKVTERAVEGESLNCTVGLFFVAMSTS
jgi:hypothetical protein